MASTMRTHGSVQLFFELLLLKIIFGQKHPNRCYMCDLVAPISQY